MLWFPQWQSCLYAQPMRRNNVALMAPASPWPTFASIVFPAATMTSVVLRNPLRVVTDVIALTGIASEPAPLRNPDANADAPNVTTAKPFRTLPAVSHSTRSGNTRTVAFLPDTCDVNSWSALVIPGG